MASSKDKASTELLTSREVRVSGVVQGVGFRPTVWRLATAAGLVGSALNDGSGVLIRLRGSTDKINQFVADLETNCPPLARIERIEQFALPPDEVAGDGFVIIASQHGEARTSVVADANSCAACIADTYNPENRRFRYPFTNCTHCGPRFSIIRGIPYDRAQTSMAAFDLCTLCEREYSQPKDRRFHAQPNACRACGPKAWLEGSSGQSPATKTPTGRDDIAIASSLLRQGSIIAVKGIGGFHLACDATNAAAVARLRQRKRRYAKPFALMARELCIIRRYCAVSAEEESLLRSSEAPIVILGATGAALPREIAPGQHTLGFLLPYTPLHHLLLEEIDRPIVLTSGNRSDEPQCISNEAAKRSLGDIADYLLLNDRDIVNRVDDSVVRVMAGAARLLRRARGYAPMSISLPQGFENSPDLLAMGGELKNTFCLLKDGRAIMSQHMGDLEAAAAYADYQKNLQLYALLFQHEPARIAIDAHPEYLSSKLGQKLAAPRGIAVDTVQHHHSHIASCLIDNAWPLRAAPVLGVVLDGLGYGGQADGDSNDALWGGEFLLAGYREAQRLASFKPVAMLGGVQAIYQPWRSAYAHLVAALGWNSVTSRFGQLELIRFLQTKPLPTLDAMLSTGTNAPLASSCGRLFDAVAAALDICRESVSYEGQAAIELEALVDGDALLSAADAGPYGFALPRLNEHFRVIDAAPMWQALLADLLAKTPRAVIAARFHLGLAQAVLNMIARLTLRDGKRHIDTIALSGGVFQNKVLLEALTAGLEKDGYRVLTHRQVPANDGGLALGQAAIAAARFLAGATAVRAQDASQPESTRRVPVPQKTQGEQRLLKKPVAATDPAAGAGARREC